MPRPKRKFNPEDAFTHHVPDLDDEDAMKAFKLRQQEDLRRWESGGLQKRRPFHKRFANAEEDGEFDPDETPSEDEYDDESGEEAWKNSEGERLRDFGVDEEAEFYDEDDVPLSELMRRRKAAAGAES